MADPTRDELVLSAVAQGDPALLLVALHQGANVDARADYAATALMHACMRNDTAMVRSLLEHKASVDARDARGTTALHCAVGVGSTAAAAALLAGGAAVDAADASGVRPLMSASLSGHAALVRALLNAGANASLADEGGGTALMRACARGHVAVAQDLLEARADPDAVESDDGTTALHSAAAAGHQTVVALLLRHGAEAGVRDAAGQTPCDLAEGQPACERLLRLAVASKRSQAPSSAPDAPSASCVLARDGGVLKTTLRPGDAAGGCPAPGSMVSVRYRGGILRAPRSGEIPTNTLELDSYHGELRLQSGDEIAIRDGPPAASAQGRDVVRAAGQAQGSPMVEGLHVAVASMTRGEVARVLVLPNHAYADTGCEAKGVPPGASLEYRLELLSWRAADAPTPQRTGAGQRATGGRGVEEERDAEALRLKERGTEAFRLGEWRTALRCYTEAVALFGSPAPPASRAGASCTQPPAAEPSSSAPSSAPSPSPSPSPSPLLAACLLNAAQCHLKLDEPAAADACCTALLRAESHAKAFYRRAEARRRLGNLEGALDDAANAQRLNPTSAEVRQLRRACQEGVVTARAEEQERAQRMMWGVAGASGGCSGPSAAAGAALAGGWGGGGPGARDGSDHEGAALALSNDETMMRAKADGREGNLSLDRATGRVSLLSDEQMGGATSAYRWSQNETELSLVVPMPRGTTRADLLVKTTTETIAVRYRGDRVLEGRLHARIVSDETVYTIEGGGAAGPSGCTLSILLTKLEPTRASEHWRCVVRGEAEIEPALFGAPVRAFHEDNPKDIAAYLEACSQRIPSQ